MALPGDVTALGVDFVPGYVWGRAAALGTPTAALVAATFGVFDPGLIGAVYEAGAAAVDREDILAARADGGAAAVSGVADDDECEALSCSQMRLDLALPATGLRHLSFP